MNVIETVLVILAFITMISFSIFFIVLCIAAIKNIVEDIVKERKK